MEKQKNNLLDAYVRMTIALGKINMIEEKQKEIDSSVKVTPINEDIDTIFFEVVKLIDCFDQKVIISQHSHVKIQISCVIVCKIIQHFMHEKHIFNFLSYIVLNKMRL